MTLSSCCRDRVWFNASIISRIGKYIGTDKNNIKKDNKVSGKNIVKCKCKIIRIYVQNSLKLKHDSLLRYKCAILLPWLVISSRICNSFNFSSSHSFTTNFNSLLNYKYKYIFFKLCI